MALSSEDKGYIVDQVVSILKSPDKVQKISQLREKVFAEKKDEATDDLDDVIYSVIQAIEELNP